MNKRIATIIRWIAFLNLIFCLGIAFALANQKKLTAMQTAVSMVWKQRNKTGTGDWAVARFREKGVLRYDSARAQAGYTLYTVVTEMATFLIDVNGRVVQKWEMPPVQQETGLRTLFGKLKPHIDAAEMYPNGDLLLVYAQPAVGEYGSTVARLDLNGNMVWKWSGGAHHTVKHVDGKIYTITGKLRSAMTRHPIKSLSHLEYLDDGLTVLDDNGHELETHSIVEMLINSGNQAWLDLVPFNPHGDPVHANDIEVITKDNYKFIPGAKPGDVLLSLRHLDAVVLADLTANKITWMLRGTFRQQHDVDLLPNGHIMVFDNEGDVTTNTGKSRSIEIDPITGGIVWEYTGTQMDPLYSENRGSQQRLSNGNTMISESNSGRIIEVTPDGDVVWEYVHPFRGVEDGKAIIASIGLDVQRYEPSDVKFLNNSEVRREAAR